MQNIFNSLLNPRSSNDDIDFIPLFTDAFTLQYILTNKISTTDPNTISKIVDRTLKYKEKMQYFETQPDNSKTAPTGNLSVNNMDENIILSNAKSKATIATASYIYDLDEDNSSPNKIATASVQNTLTDNSREKIAEAEKLIERFNKIKSELELRSKDKKDIESNRSNPRRKPAVNAAVPTVQTNELSKIEAELLTSNSEMTKIKGQLKELSTFIPKKNPIYDEILGINL
jgi:hypothetical protein